MSSWYKYPNHLAVVSAVFLAYCGNASNLFFDGSDSVAISENASKSQLAELTMQVTDWQRIVEQGQKLEVKAKLSNRTIQDVNQPFQVSFYASRDSFFSASDDPILSDDGNIEIQKIGGGEIIDISTRMTISSKFGAGAWNLFIFIDANSDISELEEENNLQGPWPFAVEMATKRPDIEYIGIYNAESAELPVILSAGKKNVPVKLVFRNGGNTSLFRESFVVGLTLIDIYNPDNIYSLRRADNWDIPVDYELKPGSTDSILWYPDLSGLSALPNSEYYLRAVFDPAPSGYLSRNNLGFAVVDEIQTDKIPFDTFTSQELLDIFGTVVEENERNNAPATGSEPIVRTINY